MCWHCWAFGWRGSYIQLKNSPCKNWHRRRARVQRVLTAQARHAHEQVRLRILVCVSDTLTVGTSAFSEHLLFERFMRSAGIISLELKLRMEAMSDSYFSAFNSIGVGPSYLGPGIERKGTLVFGISERQ